MRIVYSCFEEILHLFYKIIDEVNSSKLKHKTGIVRIICMFLFASFLSFFQVQIII